MSKTTIEATFEALNMKVSASQVETAQSIIESEDWKVRSQMSALLSEALGITKSQARRVIRIHKQMSEDDRRDSHRVDSILSTRDSEGRRTARRWN